MFRLSPSPKAPVKPTESPKAMLARVEAELTARRLVDSYNADRAVLNAQVEVQTTVIADENAETIKTVRQARREKIADNLINYAPLIIISGLAITGQYGSFSEELAPTFGDVLSKVIAALCAGALESIALFFGLHALKALRRKDSAAGLLFAATAVAGLVAFLNFTHYADADGSPTVASWTFALFSFVAPFMWRIKIRSDHRDELKENGEIDKRGLKLERSRLLWHPIDSLRVMSDAAWTGERDRDIAVAQWQAKRDAKRAEKLTKKDTKTVETVVEDLTMVHAMIENLKRDLAERDAEPVAEIVANGTRPKAITAAGAFNTGHPKWETGVTAYEASVDSGHPMTQADLAAEMGMSNRVLAGQIVRFVNERNARKGNVDHDGSDLTTETA